MQNDTEENKIIIIIIKRIGNNSIGNDSGSGNKNLTKTVTKTEQSCTRTDHKNNNKPTKKYHF